MEIEHLNNKNKEEWNNFVLNSDNAWFRHTTYWMEYIEACRFNYKPQNLSFLVKQNSETVAIVPIISQYIYEDESNNELAYYSTPTPYFAIKNDNKSINRAHLTEFINKEINKIIEEHDIKRATFLVDPLIKRNFYNDFKEFNLLKYNYNVELKTTNIINLEQNSDEIIKQMRKGHKADIKSVMNSNDWELDIIDKTNFTNKKIEIFKNIHIIDAGKQTRPNASWNCMGTWIKDDFAFLVLVKIKSLNKYCAGSLFMTYKNRSYYGSYATIDSNLLNSKIGYLVQWSAIQYMLKNNIKLYDIGENFYQNVTNDKKIMNISSFKRGFGGHEVIHIIYKKDFKY